EDGIAEAAEAAIEAAKTGKTVPLHRFSSVVERVLAHIEETCLHNIPKERQRWYAVKIFERDRGVLEELKLSDAICAPIENEIAEVEAVLDDDSECIIVNERYNYIESIIGECHSKKHNGMTTSEKIDCVVTNRFAALPIFAVIMFLVYYISITTVGGWATDWANDGVFGEGWSLFGHWIPGIPVLAESLLNAVGCADWLRSLIVDGIIGGVGAVLGFVPQMLVLFLFLAFLEACGYMARIAFVMDRLFRKFGLSGKSFIPMLIGTGCGVPGIMASRTIENERDRRMTIMTTTFIPCGAKLPVIALITSALFDGAWWVAPSAYFLGVAAIVVSGLILKKTKMFAGKPSPFVLELPAYHMPTFSNLMSSMWERGSSFIKKAGTVILLSSILIWAGSSFGFINNVFTFDTEMDLAASLLGTLGGALAWLFLPLGFGKVGTAVATIMGLVAKEEIVGVLGVLGIEGMTRLSSYSFLVFNLLCAPCMAAIGAIRREMNSPKWTAFALSYQCCFAYAISLILYQFGLLFTGNGNLFGSLAATVVTAFLVFMLVRPNKYAENA
ncbi:MAG: ferrous iron transporter B, partial [Eubacteriales bacterium]